MMCQEKNALTQLMLFEAGRRYIWGLRTLSEPKQLYGIEKYKLVEALCKVQEKAEGCIFKSATFFLQDQLSLDKVQAKGYILSEHFNFLMSNASVEGHYEMCTILCEEHDRVHELCKEIQDEFVRQNPNP